MASALATRCPTCSTVFRVVPDQLRVSEGWVRCGRCTEVFNATESLVDLDTGAPRNWADELPRGDAPPATDVDLSAIGSGAAAEAPPQEPLPQPPEAPTPEPVPHAAPAASPLEAPPLPPTFVRRAERAERWRQPRVRAALAATALLAVLGLAGQVVYEYRDLAAARFPEARPLLEQACAVLGCRIEAARAIGALAVESSGVVRVEKSGLYQLSVALRNRAGIDVALPALDLALTDTQGRLIARKVLLAADLGAASATLGAGREMALQATLQATEPDTEPVAGYTIDLFYP